MKGRGVILVLGLALHAAAWAQAPASYQPPRTSDGHPDFEGVWGNSPIATPLETNTAFGDKLVVSQAEARALADASLAGVLANPAIALQADLPDQTDMAVVRGEHRTRLIVEPANGKIPYTAAARKAAGEWSAQFARVKAGSMAENPEGLALSDRCISFGSQPPMHPALARQIVQSPGYVLISMENYGEPRIVRMTGVREPNAIRTRLGDSVGHWEGDVLVVETTAFRLDEPFYVSMAPNQNPPFMVGPDSKVIERLRRVSAEELDYTFTIEDPAIYAGPWLGEYALTRAKEGMGESSCHEGNYAVTLTLGGARRAEALAVAAKAAPSDKPGRKSANAQH